MSAIIEGDLLTVPGGIICQQVNCRGVMGAGLAKAIRAKWPKVFEEYRQAFIAGQLNLGNVIWTVVLSDHLNPLHVANICGQLYYGRSGRYTNYNALWMGFTQVRQKMFALQMTDPMCRVYIPWKIGCNLAGGDWPSVQHIIDKTVPEAIIMKHPSAS